MSSGSVNKVMIVGRLGSDPDTKTVGQGQVVTRLNIATSDSWKDKNGQRQEKTEWHRVVVWGKLAEICAKYLAKGRQVYVEGKLQTRSWDDPQGQKRYSTEVVATSVQFLGNNGPTDGGGKKSKRDEPSMGEDSMDELDDFGPEPSLDDDNGEIPF